VEGRLEGADPTQLWIGMPMILSWLTVWTEADGTAVLTYAFAPAETVAESLAETLAGPR
jgi:hypothetical protein